ncbi:MAG: DUF2958 domain-containing protein [Thaumarchaeota archaeon]|nr:DUF2958 domain-containing protein [Nitrososphaerota archaeon]
MTEVQIPGLYETESVALEEKTIFQRYEIKSIGFYWLISELDSDQNLAFGYANLNDDEMAEWGYISIAELLENGASLDRDWKPCKFQEALRKIRTENSV